MMAGVESLGEVKIDGIKLTFFVYCHNSVLLKDG
jgi:hypothetical protein